MLPEEDVMRCSQMTPTDPEYPQMISDTKWMKGERNGAREDRRVELGR